VDRGVGAGRDIRDSTIHIGLDENETGQRIVEAQRPVTETTCGADRSDSA
jgi:hypothetical protein